MKKQMFKVEIPIIIIIVIVTLNQVASQQSINLKRLPYLTAVTEASAVITYGFQPGTVSNVSYVKYSTSVDDFFNIHQSPNANVTYLEWLDYPNPYNTSMFQHRINLTDSQFLKPSITLCYSVFVLLSMIGNGNDGNEEQQVTPYYCFRLAPDPNIFIDNDNNNDGIVEFFAWGDFGVDSDDQRMVSDAMGRHASFPNIDFMLALGDNSYFYGKHHEYHDRVFPYYDHLWLSKPLVLTPGNHDYQLTDPDNGDWSGVDARAYRTIFEQYYDEKVIDSHRGKYFSFQWSKTVHFISVDTEMYGFSIEDQNAMLSWMESDLSSETSQSSSWRFLFLHKVAFVNGNIADTFVLEKILPIALHHRVQLMVGGHWHKYERYPAYDNITTMITSGGGGYALFGEYVPQKSSKKLLLDETAINPNVKFISGKANVDPIVDITAHHFLHISINDETATIEAISKYDEIIDSIIIQNLYV